MNHGFQSVRVGFIFHNVVDDLADRVIVFTEGVVQLSHLQVSVQPVALVLLRLVRVLCLCGAAVALALQHVADDDSDQAQQEEDRHQGKRREVMASTARPSTVRDSHCGIIWRRGGGVGHEGPKDRGDGQGDVYWRSGRCL